MFAITWGTTYLLRLPLAYLLSGVDIPLPNGSVLRHPLPLEPSLAGLWIGLTAEVLLRCVIFTARFLQGGWAAKRV